MPPHCYTCNINNPPNKPQGGYCKLCGSVIRWLCKHCGGNYTRAWGKKHEDREAPLAATLAAAATKAATDPSATLALLPLRRPPPRKSSSRPAPHFPPRPFPPKRLPQPQPQPQQQDYSLPQTQLQPQPRPSVPQLHTQLLPQQLPSLAALSFPLYAHPLAQTHPHPHTHAHAHVLPPLPAAFASAGDASSESGSESAPQPHCFSEHDSDCSTATDYQNCHTVTTLPDSPQSLPHLLPQSLLHKAAPQSMKDADAAVAVLCAMRMSKADTAVPAAAHPFDSSDSSALVFPFRA